MNCRGSDKGLLSQTVDFNIVCAMKLGFTLLKGKETALLIIEIVSEILPRKPTEDISILKE
jgi:hypothetical protein